MLRAAHPWRSPEAVPVPAEAIAAGRALDLSERQVRLLAQRGVGASELAAFVGPAAQGLHDPRSLPDAELVVERIRRARSGGERILVFGDFDADGLTGLAILAEAFGALGLDVDVHVPSRVADGHGLSRRAVEDAAVRGARLIVTVDCGTASAEEIALAARRGIDVIVTDHHHVPPTLPPAAAIVNPQRADSRYPDPRISGAGVALKVAQLLLGELGGPGSAGAALALTELAAIGTVADVAPLMGENRAIVRLGLERMRSTPRPGLAALFARAGVTPATVDVETLGYVVAPRLNAAGRLGDATTAARLLLTRDAGEAATLAAALEATNVERRALLASALDEARRGLAEAGQPGDAPVVLAAGPWSPGIVGLVAGRLAEEHGRPAIVASTDVSPWRVSARGGGPADGIRLDLAVAFEACADLLERYGGHRDAAGCTLDPLRWDGFRARLLTLAATLAPPPAVPALQVDLVVAASEVDYRLLRELATLEPTGPGNPAPLVAITGFEVARARSASGGHSQLTLRKGARAIEVLDAIAFDRPDIAPALAPGDRLDVVARLTSREFGGYESLQVLVVDAASEGGAVWIGAGERADPTGSAGPAGSAEPADDPDLALVQERVA